MASETSVILTDQAAEKVKEFFAQEGYDGGMLRIDLVRTHCMGGRGYAHKLAVETSQTEGDVVQDAQGLRIVLRQDDLPRLEGTVVDYEEGLDHSGFSVQNPHSVGKCPCGHHDIFD
jgi:iron-sulfur cluster assembly accessory protein